MHHAIAISLGLIVLSSSGLAAPVNIDADLLNLLPTLDFQRTKTAFTNPADSNLAQASSATQNIALSNTKRSDIYDLFPGLRSIGSDTLGTAPSISIDPPATTGPQKRGGYLGPLSDQNIRYLAFGPSADTSDSVSDLHKRLSIFDLDSLHFDTSNFFQTNPTAPVATSLVGTTGQVDARDSRSHDLTRKDSLTQYLNSLGFGNLGVGFGNVISPHSNILGRYSVDDFLNDNPKVVEDVKNLRFQSIGTQLSDLPNPVGPTLGST